MAFTFGVFEFWGYIEKNLLVFSILNACLSIFWYSAFPLVGKDYILPKSKSDFP